MNFKFGFIGCGNMGSALVAAAAKTLNANEIAIFDRDEKKLAAYTESGRAIDIDFEALCEKSDFIFLGVKPQVLPDVLAAAAETLKARDDRYVLVSMAAGVDINAIEKIAGDDVPIIRIMPNTPVSAGEGMILYSVNGSVTADDERQFLEGLKAAGRFDKIPENLIDAGGALSGCGPAFVYLFAEALADGGVECGLPRDKAQLYAAQTLLGAAQMILSSDKSPAALKDAVCSPGGTTIAGVHALENGKLRGTVMNAVRAAFDKTALLKK